MKTIHILATAHGTDSAEGRAAINLVRVELDDMLRAHGGSQDTQYQVHEAYVDVQSPNVDEAALALPKEELCVIVPILLSTGFHTQVDLRRAAKIVVLHRCVSLNLWGQMPPWPHYRGHA